MQAGAIQGTVRLCSSGEVTRNATTVGRGRKEDIRLDLGYHGDRNWPRSYCAKWIQRHRAAQRTSALRQSVTAVALPR